VIPDALQNGEENGASPPTPVACPLDSEIDFMPADGAFLVEQ
jgi:hypothetical protein